MSGVIKILIYAAIAYLAIVAIAYFAQRKFTYFPNPSRVAPAAAGLEGFREVELPTPDGERIMAWYAPAPPGRPTILYFHGNGGGLANRSGRFGRYQQAGLGIFVMSYRGYSGSTGSPTEAHNIADARLAYDHLLKQGVKPSDIFLYGESLGSGVAVQTAAAVPVGGVILDAPYTSIVEVGAKAYPILPLRWLMVDRYESDKRIAAINAPLLILHGARDQVIPLEMGQRMHALAREPKRIVVFPEGHHIDLDQYGAVAVVRAWIDEVRQK
jgi:fermentation-respiration switch protein FrsA (DUF1100 family)